MYNQFIRQLFLVIFMLFLGACNVLIINAEELHCRTLISQGIGPLFSFGHTILSHHSCALYEKVILIGQKDPTRIIFNQMDYGITPSCTVNIMLPCVSHKDKDIHEHQVGIGDLSLNGSYLFHKNAAETYSHRIIGVAGIQLPTTTTPARTYISLNTVSFFLGIAQDSLTSEWYVYHDHGIQIPLKRKGIKYGANIISNFGFGKVFCLGDANHVIPFIEISNLYKQPTKGPQHTTLSAAADAFFFGASFRLQYHRLLLQTGIQFPLTDTSNTHATKIKYVAIFAAAYIF